MGEFKEPIISYLPEVRKKDETPKIPEDIREFLEGTAKKEQEMFEETGRRAEVKGKSGWHKKTAGFLVGLTLLGVVSAARAEGGILSVLVKGRANESILIREGAKTARDIYREMKKAETEQRKAEEREERARIKAETEKRRAEEREERTRERTEQGKVKTGGDVAQTKIEEEEKTERKRIETGVETHKKDQGATISGPYGDVKIDEKTTTTEKGAPVAPQEKKAPPSVESRQEETQRKFLYKAGQREGLIQFERQIRTQGTEKPTLSQELIKYYRDTFGHDYVIGVVDEWEQKGGKIEQQTERR